MPTVFTARRSMLAAAALVAVGVAGLVALPQQQAAEAAAAAQQPQVQQAKQYDVDPVHTSVIFSTLYMGQSPFYGQFTNYRGTMSYDGENAESLKLDVEIPVESIDTHNEQRNNHLRSPDFFNAREFPTIRFTSDQVTTNEDGTRTISGQLSLHGQTKPIEATLTHLAAGQKPNGDRLGVGAHFTIKRSDFGMTTMLGDNGIGDEITLYVGVQGVAK